MARKARPKYYAVRVGRQAGIYTTWQECSAQVSGHQGAHHVITDTTVHASTQAMSTRASGPLKRRKSTLVQLLHAQALKRNPTNDPPQTRTCPLTTMPSPKSGPALPSKRCLHPPSCLAPPTSWYDCVGVGSAQPSSVACQEFDGASRSNPGVAGAGAVLIDSADGRQVAVIRQCFERATNNQAEAAALLLGLEVQTHLLLSTVIHWHIHE